MSIDKMRVVELKAIAKERGYKVTQNSERLSWLNFYKRSHEFVCHLLK